jgi:hypothetical protein
MVTMLFFAKTAFASPRWLRGARRFAGFFARAADREARHEASLAVVFTAWAFTSPVDAARTRGGGASKSPPSIAQAFLSVRFFPAFVVDFFRDI